MVVEPRAWGSVKAFPAKLSWHMPQIEYMDFIEILKELQYFLQSSCKSYATGKKR
jgi:hypothetical protein